MNTTLYIISRLLLPFGLNRKNKWLKESAEEMHLLCQFEESLGEKIWTQAEEIEAVSVEYWMLRKLKNQVEEIEGLVQNADTFLNVTHDERNAILTQTNQDCQTLLAQRDDYVRESKELGLKRDEIIVEARAIKRKFEAARMKIQVLEEEGGSDDVVAQERGKIQDYKREFEALNQKRNLVGDQIDAIDNQIDLLEKSIGVDRKRLRKEASEAYQSIGKVNLEVSKLASEIGSFQAEMQTHYGAIGHYVSRHAGMDLTCTKLCKEHSHLVARIQTLRSSVVLNHKLASMAREF